MLPGGGDRPGGALHVAARDPACGTVDRGPRSTRTGNHEPADGPISQPCRATCCSSWPGTPTGTRQFMWQPGANLTATRRHANWRNSCGCYGGRVAVVFAMGAGGRGSRGGTPRLFRPGEQRRSAPPSPAPPRRGERYASLHDQVSGERRVGLGLVGLATGQDLRKEAFERSLRSWREGKETLNHSRQSTAVARDTESAAAGGLIGGQTQAHVEGGLAVAQPSPPDHQAEQQQRPEQDHRADGVQRPTSACHRPFTPGRGPGVSQTSRSRRSVPQPQRTCRAASSSSSSVRLLCGSRS